MHSYKFIAPTFPATAVIAVRRDDGWSVPLNQDNRFCRLFVRQWKDGADVKNPDGSPAPYSDEAVRALDMDPPADEGEE